MQQYFNEYNTNWVHKCIGTYTHKKIANKFIHKIFEKNKVNA